MHHKQNIPTPKPNEIEINNPELIALMVDVLTQGKDFRFKATGGSMSPFIRNGDMLQISPLSDKKPGLGQVLAYHNPVTGSLIIHRLVGSSATYMLFRGDSYARNMQEKVSNEDLIGLVTAIEKTSKVSHFSLGIERIPIALLSRYNLLFPIIRILHKIKSFLQVKSINY